MLFVSLLVTTVAFLGGLFVSWCKRRANVKDTGSVLPGHGGFLDRFDSVLGLTLLLWIMLVVGGWWL
jgi:phosphatidate cytidylyltransferase